MTDQGKKVWKELEKMGWSNEPEDLHLEYFEDIIEATKKVLTIPAVAGRSEQLVCPHCKGLEVYVDEYGGKPCKCTKQAN